MALKGLLRAAGLASHTRTHGLRGLAERCRDELGMAVSADELGDLARLERDYQPARCPDALPAGTPRGAYDDKDYQRARTTVKAVRARVTATWQALVAAAEAGTRDG
ncbi:MAG TPA: HEPN domain-containing protein [Egibacteraceae bacterium]|nr:HEPN domain-containing protein [Egibacteraceae bacterium]